MPVVAQCANCLTPCEFQEDGGTTVCCPTCQQQFLVTAPSLDIAIAQGLPPVSEHATSIQGSPKVGHLTCDDGHVDGEALPNVEWSLGVVLAMLGLRFSSPFAWLGALVLFFLPWFDVQCMDNRGNVSHATVNGPLIVTRMATRQVAAPILLAVYCLGLVLAIIVSLALGIGLVRTTFGITMGMLLFFCFLIGTWSFMNDPMIPRLEMRVVRISVTPWYFASIAVNVCAIACFAIEWYVDRKNMTYDICDN